MSTEILEDNCDGSKSHPIINRIESCSKIYDSIKQRQPEWKGSLLSTRNMGKGLHKLFQDAVDDISQVLPILGESGSEVSHFIPDIINFSEVTRFSGDINKPRLRVTLK